MPLLEGLSIGAEKNAVIFDIGHAYTKCGFAGEPSPRFILPSIVKKTRVGESYGTSRSLSDYRNKEDLMELLVEFFHQLYYRYLLVNPKDRRVVIIESILCPTEFREQLAHVMFNHFEVPSLLLAPAHLVSLFTLGVQTGLVLDCGFKESLVIPLYEGYPLLKAWQSAPLAAKSIHKNLSKLLLESASTIDDAGNPRPLGETKDSLPEETLEDIKVRSCFVTPISRAKQWYNSELGGDNQEPKVCEPSFQYPLACSGQMITVPTKLKELAAEVLFELDNDQLTVPALLLDALLACPIDIRKSLAENILLIGGTCQLPGFKSRVKEELNDMLSLPKYEGLAIKTFKFHSPPGHENYIAWLGGAMFGALEALPVRSVSREAYLDKQHVPDWVSMCETQEVSEEIASRK